MFNCSPVVLFVYGRPLHTKRVLAALRKCKLAQRTDLIVYSDAARSAEDESSVREVRKIVNVISGFSSVSIVMRENNYGLAENIIDGVTSVVSRYGRVIVLEDDIMVAPTFLQFMNDALNRYKYEPKVWHVSGWNYPISGKGVDDAFFWRVMNCWGWATWSDRWVNFNKSPSALIELFTGSQIKKFNLDGKYDFWCQVTGNNEGHISTWAVFWYATIFIERGYCLNVTNSQVENIGFDGSGEHCGNEPFVVVKFNPKTVKVWPRDVATHELAVERIKAFYKGRRTSFSRRILRGLRRVFFR